MLIEQWRPTVETGRGIRELHRCVGDRHPGIITRQIKFADHPTGPDMRIVKNVFGGIDRTAGNLTTDGVHDGLFGQCACPVRDDAFDEMLMPAAQVGIARALIVHQISTAHGQTQRLPVTGTGCCDGYSPIAGGENAEGAQIRMMLTTRTE